MHFTTEITYFSMEHILRMIFVLLLTLKFIIFGISSGFVLSTRELPSQACPIFLEMCLLSIFVCLSGLEVGLIFVI